MILAGNKFTMDTIKINGTRDHEVPGIFFDADAEFNVTVRGTVNFYGSVNGGEYTLLPGGENIQTIVMNAGGLTGTESSIVTYTINPKTLGLAVGDILTVKCVDNTTEYEYVESFEIVKGSSGSRGFGFGFWFRM